MGQTSCLSLPPVARGEFEILPCYETPSSSSCGPSARPNRRGGITQLSLANRRRPRKKGSGTGQWLKSVIQGNQLCQDLPSSEIQPLVDSLEFYVFQQGEHIVTEGQYSTHLFIPHSEGLQVYVGGRSVSRLPRGRAFGEHAVLQRCPQSVSVVASKTGCCVWGAEGRLFRRALYNSTFSQIDSSRALVDSLAIFAGLTAGERDRLCDLSTIMFLPQGEQLNGKTHSEADTVSMYFVKQGELQVLGGDGPGREKTVRWLRPGDWIGERVLLYDEPFGLTVVADTRSELLCMDVHGMRDVLDGRLDAVWLQQHFLRESLMRVGLLRDMSAAEQLSTVRSMGLKEYSSGNKIQSDGLLCVVLDGVVQALGDSSMEVLLCGESFRTSLAAGPSRRSGTPQFVAGPMGCSIATLDDSSLQSTEVVDGSQPFTCGAKSMGDSREHELARMGLMLKKVYIFRDLRQKQIGALAVGTKRHTYPYGAKVVEQGEMSSHLFVIVSGEVHVLSNGHAVRKLGKYSYFGENAVIFGKPRGATIKVNTFEAEIWSIERETILRILREKPHVYEDMMYRIRLQDSSILRRDLRELEVVGFGNSGEVRIVEHVQTGFKYALKRVSKVDNEVPPEVQHEIEILAEFDHPFIVYLVKTFETMNHVCMLTEYIAGGELHAAIRTIPTVLSQEQAMFYTGSILLMLEVLQDRKVVYRDLKPENIMLDASGYLKLIDFGTAKRLTTARPKTFTQVGTPHYMAPEVMRGKGYACEVDIWALGVILYELVVGYLPFGINDLETFTEVCKAVMNTPLSFPSVLPPNMNAAKSLINGLLDSSPKTRLGCGPTGYEAIKSSPFFEINTPNKARCYGERTFAGDFFDLLICHDVKAPIIPNDNRKGDSNSFRQQSSFTHCDSGELAAKRPRSNYDTADLVSRSRGHTEDVYSDEMTPWSQFDSTLDGTQALPPTWTAPQNPTFRIATETEEDLLLPRSVEEEVLKTGRFGGTGQFSVLRGSASAPIVPTLDTDSMSPWRSEQAVDSVTSGPETKLESEVPVIAAPEVHTNNAPTVGSKAPCADTDREQNGHQQDAWPEEENGAAFAVVEQIDLNDSLNLEVTEEVSEKQADVSALPFDASALPTEQFFADFQSAGECSKDAAVTPPGQAFKVSNFSGPSTGATAKDPGVEETTQESFWQGEVQETRQAYSPSPGSSIGAMCHQSATISRDSQSCEEDASEDEDRFNGTFEGTAHEDASRIGEDASHGPAEPAAPFYSDYLLDPAVMPTERIRVWADEVDTFD